MLVNVIQVQENVYVIQENLEKIVLSLQQLQPRAQVQPLKHSVVGQCQVITKVNKIELNLKTSMVPSIFYTF